MNYLWIVVTLLADAFFLWKVGDAIAKVRSGYRFVLTASMLRALIGVGFLALAIVCQVYSVRYGLTELYGFLPALFLFGVSLQLSKNYVFLSDHSIVLDGVTFSAEERREEQEEMTMAMGKIYLIKTNFKYSWVYATPEKIKQLMG